MDKKLENILIRITEDKKEEIKIVSKSKNISMTTFIMLAVNKELEQNKDIIEQYKNS